jgi:hypothetical protein
MKIQLPQPKTASSKALEIGVSQLPKTKNKLGQKFGK